MEGSNSYVLGDRLASEGERLLQQCRGLEREARWLLEQIGVRAGWRTVDVGCGPVGVYIGEIIIALEQLAATDEVNDLELAELPRQPASDIEPTDA